MSFNILNAAGRYLTPEFISKSALFLGESESSVGKAFSGLIPVALGGLAIKANATADDASDILDVANSAYKNDTLNKISDYFNEKENSLNNGLTLERALFGDRLSGIIGSVVSFSEIKEASAKILFTITTRLVAAVSGKYSTDMNLSAASLASFLHGQKANIFSSLPAELSGIAKLIGLSGIGENMQSYLKYKSKYTDQPLYKKKKNQTGGY